MIVVSDTPPLNYLALIGKADLLGQLFGAVIIPPAVAAELFHSGAPKPTRELFLHPPRWLATQEPRDDTVQAVRIKAGKKLSQGDIEAISLARDLQADYLLTDDKDARKEAEKNHHLRVTGTIGVLALGAIRGLIDLPSTIEQLMATKTFRMPELIVRELLSKDAKRKESRRFAGPK